MDIHLLYGPFMKHFRTKRMNRFASQFSLSSQTILDVGGDPFNWRLLPVQIFPQVTYVNIYANEGDSTWVIANGCALPFQDKSFEIVYSNSVIEHLGTIHNQRLFAQECERVGIRLFIQTPNKGFLVEPHLLTPFVHWLPRTWQQRLLRRFTVWGVVTKPTQKQCDEFMNEVRLLTADEMQQLFQNAEIQHERFLGFTKSLIAVRLDNV